MNSTDLTGKTTNWITETDWTSVNMKLQWLNLLFKERFCDYARVLLLTAISGALFLGIWKVFSRRMGKQGGSSLQFHALLAGLVFFLVPVGSSGLYVLEKKLTLWRGYVLIGTPFFYFISRPVVMVWLLGMLAMAVSFIIKIVVHKRKFGSAAECALWKRELFKKVCAELGIAEGKVHLAESYHAPVPFLEGLIRPRVILPVREYPEEELRMVFLHELIHYRQHSIPVKYLTMLMITLQWINWFAWRYRSRVFCWSEYVCDDEVIRRIPDEQRYYAMLGKMALEGSRTSTSLTSLVAEKDCEVMDRIKHAVSGNRKPVSRKRERCALLCLLLLGTLAVGFSVEAYAELHVRAFYYTKQEHEIPRQPLPEYVIYHENGIPEGITVEEGEWQIVLESERGTVLGLDWTVPANTRVMSDYFYLNVGDTCYISGILSPTGETVKTGLMTGNNEAYHTDVANGFLVHFNITSPGFYRVFVENSNNVSVAVTGSVLIQP